MSTMPQPILNSNPGGSNQNLPGSLVPTMPSATSSTSNPNPYTPAGVSTGTTTIPTSGTTNTTTSTGTSTSSASLSDLTNIFGAGVGGDIQNFLNSLSGTDSQVLQEYIQSLQPAFAQNAATLGMTLGSSGVGANSSVNAIAQSNLTAQENAMIAGESAQLTQGAEGITANMLEGMMGPAAAAQVSPWQIISALAGPAAGIAEAAIMA